ncbi:Bacterial transferase hexapeptide (six repeats) family protein [Clavispora lusitaniae]|uniref:Dynactin subunit 5 n=1 Tax=Clavispora lusitaniae (strain ATCC 42720) TaxID=306902 RepID=C4Y7K7_CLAL4|nr:uncharacterized protein CLUG_04185 [Clavispora lusitaniae ATCC 42720]EEQ40057.1 hypothetical protein CLUG_04185 [Clavispora lusitaniae ATCC 42720]KAF7581982.1 Bacterial transferase hexapeptide (six repeats) family protein [Clavispora lusitaniae]
MDEWIETGTGNRISRNATIAGSDRISISGNCTISKGCVLNGDVNTKSKDPSIVLGKYGFFSENTRVEPPVAKKNGDTPMHSNVVIGNYTFFGSSTVIRSAQVGNRVYVGSNCQLGEMSVINDCCVISDGTVIPPKSVIPPYSEVSGVPGKDYDIAELNGGYRKVLETDARIRHVLGE